MPKFVLVLATAFAVSAIISPTAVSSNKFIKLSSDQITATINTSAAQLISIENSQTRETYSVSSDSAALNLESGSISLGNVHMKLISRTKTSVTFRGQEKGLEITRSYSFPANRAYFDRSLVIRNLLSQPILLKSVVDCSLEFTKPFESAHYHDDGMDKGDEEERKDGNMIYRNSTNVFMRNATGGLYAGLEYPGFKADLSPECVSLSYLVNYRMKPGQTLNLPTMFIGVYKKLGYTVRKQIHWKPRVVSPEQEILDLGEVRAMQKFMCDYLPEEPMPHPGYYIWFSSWWSDPTFWTGIHEKEADAYCRMQDFVKKAGCFDMMTTGSVWCGYANCSESCPAIDNVGPDAVFPRNQWIDKVMDHAKSIGLDMAGWADPLGRCYRHDRPDLLFQISKDQAPDGSHGNCQASDEFEDWFYRFTCSAIDTYKLNSWSWDIFWMQKPCICYGKTHGHELGDCEFQQYRNVTGMIQKIRQRYPNMFLEIYWGLKEGGTWAHKGLNSLENLYENNPGGGPDMSLADDMRYQMWYNHNYRFIPTYMNLAQINNRKEGKGLLYSILSCLSASTHAGFSDKIPFQTDAEAEAVLAPIRKWKAWGTENMAYLKDAIDLFGQPFRKDGIDGTAHIIGDTGFIFVFNPWKETHWGSIPLTDMIGLTKGSKYSLCEISTDSPKPFGTYKRGEDFVFSIQGKSALLFELKPTTESVNHATAPNNVTVQPAFVR